MGATTDIKDELRKIGPADPGKNARRMRADAGGPMTKTLVSGEAPPPSPEPSRAVREHVEEVRAVAARWFVVWFEPWRTTSRPHAR